MTSNSYENSYFHNLFERSDEEYLSKKIELKQIIESLSTKTSYIFRKNNFWYIFEEWILPNKGIIRRWDVKDESDWIPKKDFTTEFRKDNSTIIFDVGNLPKQFEGYEINRVSISSMDSYLAITVSKDGYFDIAISELESISQQTKWIRNISLEASFDFVDEGIVFVRTDHLGRPSKVYYESFIDPESILIYEEVEDIFRIRIQKVNEPYYTLIKSESYSRSEVYVYSTKQKLDLIEIWSKSKSKPVSINILTVQGKKYAGIVIKDKNRKGRCLLREIDGVRKVIPLCINIDETISIHKIWEINDVILVKYLKKEHIQIGVLLTKNIKNIEEIFLIKELQINSHSKLYQNNFSPNLLFFIEYNNICDETIFAYSMLDFKKSIVFQSNILTKDEKICSSMVWASSRDKNTQIPISLYWKCLSDDNDLYKRKGVVNVYGAYGKKEKGINLDPMAVAVIEAGFLYCIAHVRGGGFLGGKWYRAGKQGKKWNSIYDLIDCCDFLINEKILNEEQIGLISSSAGGIVAGASLNVRPNLFKAMLLFSPFINPLGALMDLEDPLSKTETIEWGDPINNPEDRKYIESYSPLQNVQNALGSKTSIVSITGLQDIYVSTKDILKWSNKLNYYKVDSKVYVNSQVGHGGIGAGDFEFISKILSNFLCSIGEKKYDNE
ncbi:prolyl oligopeptidase family serine peptidase [Enterococcus phoeniculicola]|uniref:prolyl oligopeptidase family serine peptidase n=1 Tax=Enterococcus phoeniculicola TaxID=154621 RepID=UPI0005593661|nr:prolyl oligopeptidase family serine peptidase [Enterococcus phoeniculicola]